MTQKTVLMCMGTRPEIIKLAPLYHALCAQEEFKTVILHSGQHDSLAESMYRFFDISPDYRFQLTRQSQSLNHLFALMMDQLDKLFHKIKPDVVLVQGDTSTALASALTGYYYRCQIGHVEAGLRTFCEYEPFPEEKNRVLITQLAHWHFAPTTKAEQNLKAEHIPASHVYPVGNTIVDAVNWAQQHLEASAMEVNASLGPLKEWIETQQHNKRLVVVATHRRESWNGDIANIAQAVHDAAQRFPDLHFVWPVHPNLVVKNAVHETLQGLDSGTTKHIHLIDPISYPALIWLLQRAWLVLTDSGGIQEEAVTLGKPLLILRNKTERPEVIDAHAGILTGTQRDNIVNCIQRLHDSPDYYASFICRHNPFGDGHSAQRISEILTRHLLTRTNQDRYEAYLNN
jgi:UDP-N-acetylglucosamine 2-epimerase (non-hydrolysing)